LGLDLRGSQLFVGRPDGVLFDANPFAVRSHLIK